MSRLDWSKAKRRRSKPQASKRERVKVHPNSTAAKKWGRTTWERRS